MTRAAHRFSAQRVVLATMAILILAGGVWFWREWAAMTRAKMRIGCAWHMKYVLLACLHYREDHDGAWPRRFTDLVLPAGHDPEDWKRIFTCPAQGQETGDWDALDTWTDYRLVTELKPGNPANVVLVYESPANHHHAGVNVGFADGHVEWIPMTRLPSPLAGPTRIRERSSQE